MDATGRRWAEANAAHVHCAAVLRPVDKGIEDTIYNSQAIRGFVGIDLTHESASDATTLFKFRRLLEKHNLTRRTFDEINGHLSSKGLMMREGTIVDATLIAAPSTKNRDEKLDPEMLQSKKGKNWFFGMKANIGVDAKSGLAHTLVTTAGNVSDVTQTHRLMHGDETIVFGDAGYQGADKRLENAAKAVTWHIVMKQDSLRDFRWTANAHYRRTGARSHQCAALECELPRFVVRACTWAATGAGGSTTYTETMTTAVPTTPRADDQRTRNPAPVTG